MTFWSKLYNVQKRVFVQYCTCTDKGFGILPPNTPRHLPLPPPHPRISLCTCILYNINWDCCITCGGGDLLKCPADSKADDGIHAHAHSHNNNRLFTFKFKDTYYQSPRHVSLLPGNCNWWGDFKQIWVSSKFDNIQKPPQRFILS